MKINGIALNKDLQPVLRDLEVEPQENDEVVRLTHSAINHRDIWITRGMYPGLISGCFMGSDGCGTVQDRRVIINPGLNWGNDEAFQSRSFEVLGIPSHGTFADHIVIPSHYIYNIPDHLTMEESAALPLAGLTAFRALVRKCNPNPGEKVLISGIGGGVALMAFQMAKAFGCEVYVTSGHQWKIDRAISMGAAGGVNYREESWYEDLKTMAGGFNIIVDSAAGEGFKHFIGLSNPGARIVFYGGTRGRITALNPQAIFWKQISIFGSTMGSDRDFSDMLGFVSKHRIVPVVDRVIPLNKWEEAFRIVAEGNQFGKIVFDHTH